MNEAIINALLACPSCKNQELRSFAFERNRTEISQGVAFCSSCGVWYRIEDGLLELLVPSLRDPERQKAFCQRFAAKWDGWDRCPTPVQEIPHDEHKWGQKNFYDEDALSYETRMLCQAFWRAFDLGFQKEIESVSGARGLMLEVGGGTGRVSLPMRGTFDAILSFDISESMVRTAMRKRDELRPLPGHIHYFVADAENMPIRNDIVDIAVFSGILHHVESPNVVIGEVARTLKKSGRFIGLENNRSAFRPIFDGLMRLRKLWNEKAHEAHFVMSGAEISRWLQSAGLTGRVWTSVFLPPHLLNLFSVNVAGRLMHLSDGLIRKVPWIKNQGGLVLFSGTKNNSCLK